MLAGDCAFLSHSAKRSKKEIGDQRVKGRTSFRSKTSEMRVIFSRIITDFQGRASSMHGLV